MDHHSYRVLETAINATSYHRTVLIPEASPGPPEYRADPEAQLWIAMKLVALGWAAMTLQEVLLFARPTPYGEPFVLYWSRYFWFAVLFNLLGLMLASLPFLAFWLAARRPVAPPHARAIHALHLGVVILVVALDQIDNELMRFMGTHLTLGLLETYERVMAWSVDNLHIIEQDRGGPFLPFAVLLAIPLALLWLGPRLIASRSGPNWPHSRMRSSVIVVLLVPLTAYSLPGGGFRRYKIQPAIFTLILEGIHDANEHLGAKPPDLDGLAAAYRSRWIEESNESGWRFSEDKEFPLLRLPGAPSTSGGEPWNVIYLQMETFRAWNVGTLHADPQGSPTPFIDQLASRPESAIWTRHLSFGPPTVSGFIAGHCSIRPHHLHNITTTHTYTHLLCLPAMLREHGWHTAYFSGSDPDWDNETLWVHRWYDELEYYRDANLDDRIVFDRAADRIRQMGRQAKPFFATVVSVSNHYPFRSHDPASDIDAGLTPAGAIRNTMHFTDAVVGKFLGSLSAEPWFRHTLVVITGDHGYNLGEHDHTAGQLNGWRESVWVPLIITGDHPRLPRGRHDQIASQLDIAPTIADLLGVQQAVPWLGRSLLHPGSPQRTISMRRGDAVYSEDDRFGLVMDPATGHARLYDARHDPLQQVDVADRFPGEVRRLVQRARDDQRLTDYLVESDRVWRR